jgi:nucleoside-diphosphate-sugar epimerase
MKLVVGCGYLGSRVAKLWQIKGEMVFATTRDPRRAAELDSSGLRPIFCDVTDAASLRTAGGQLEGVDTVFYSVGYDRSSIQGRRAVFVNGLRNVLDILPTSARRVIYVSTTGVYGQDDGGWIDEDSACEPTRESGRLFVEAECLLKSHRIGDRAIILRMAGIYGPGRIPSLDNLRDGLPIAADDEGYINLIHVDDAAKVAVAVEAHAKPPRTYLVSDGIPVRRREFYDEVSKLFHTPPAVFVEQSADTNRRGNTSKRVINARLRQEIPVELTYPNYREGLAAIARAMRSSFGGWLA